MAMLIGVDRVTKQACIVGVAVVAIILCRPAAAKACSCVGPLPSSASLRGADLVFVGTVTGIGRSAPLGAPRQNADRVENIGGVDLNAPDLVTFDVSQTFKGQDSRRQSLGRAHTSCDIPFAVGEEWLVYATRAADEVSTNACFRTRLYSDAAQDLAFLEGMRSGRLQGTIYGTVVRRVNRPSDTRLQVVSEPLRVVAANAAQRFVTVTDRADTFDLVLPPGDFEIWVERSEMPVAPKSQVHVDHASDVRVLLVADY